MQPEQVTLEVQELPPEPPTEAPFSTPKLTPFLTQGGDAMASGLAPLPTGFGFVSKRGPGRNLTFWEVVQLLKEVRKTGRWPSSISQAMQRYYKREYTEYFRDGKRAETKRAENEQKARELKAQNRPSRSTRNRIPIVRPEPIDLEEKRRARM